MGKISASARVMADHEIKLGERVAGKPQKIAGWLNTGCFDPQQTKNPKYLSSGIATDSNSAVRIQDKYSSTNSWEILQDANLLLKKKNTWVTGIFFSSPNEEQEEQEGKREEQQEQQEEEKWEKWEEKQDGYQKMMKDKILFIFSPEIFHLSRLKSQSQKKNFKKKNFKKKSISPWDQVAPETSHQDLAGEREKWGEKMKKERGKVTRFLLERRQI